MGDRRSAREAALQILFQQNFSEKGAAISYSLIKLDPNHDCTDFSNRIVAGVLRYRFDIDKTIKERAERWKTERMAIVDLNILRIAIFEMVYGGETPAKVVINEAVDIAKKYGNENSGAFVNGILDAIHHALPQVCPPPAQGKLEGVGK